MTFPEDQSRVRKGHAEVNLSILAVKGTQRTLHEGIAEHFRLRRTALSMLRNERTMKVGIKNKRLTAGWDEDYLEQVLVGSSVLVQSPWGYFPSGRFGSTRQPKRLMAGLPGHCLNQLAVAFVRKGGVDNKQRVDHAGEGEQERQEEIEDCQERLSTQ